MVHHGQLEQNDADNLQSELGKKIYAIYSQPTEIKLLEHAQRIVHLSELTDVFSHEQLHEWGKTLKFDAKSYEVNELIATKDVPHNNTIYYVT